MPATSRQQYGARRRPKWWYAVAGIARRAQHRNALGSTAIMMGAIAALLGLGSVAVLSLTCASPAPFSRHAAGLIQGPQALRLDLLRQASWPFAAPGWPHRHAHPPPTDFPGAQAPGYSTVDPAAGSRESSIKVVCEFYRWLHADPASAVPLVAPEVLGDETTVVTRSWAEVTSVRPRHVRVQPDGSVLAEVLVEYSDGGRLLLRHRLTVQPGPQPKITKVELLAARSFRS